MTNAIITERLSKSYSIRAASADGSLKRVHKMALDELNLEVPEGQILGIIGRNGAGKSTLLKVLARISVPTSGKAIVRGRVASLLEVGTGMHPEMTGRENIYLNGALLGMSRKDVARAFDEIVTFAGIPEYLDTPIKRYSSGMKLRLAFAVAAHLHADVLIVDEVLAVGDAEFQSKCIGAMARYEGAGRTVLFVSHNLGTLKQLCQRGIVLDQGKLSFDGPAEAAVDWYLGKVLGGTPGQRDASGPLVSGSLELIRFGLSLPTGEPTTTVRSGEHVRVEIDIKGGIDEPAPTLLLWVSGAAGERLSIISSRLAGLTLPKFQERLVVSVDVGPLMLVPGQYVLSVAVASSRGVKLSHWEHIQGFEVHPAADLPALSLPPVNNRGIVYSPARFTMHGSTK